MLDTLIEIELDLRTDLNNKSTKIDNRLNIVRPTANKTTSNGNPWIDAVVAAEDNLTGTLPVDTLPEVNNFIYYNRLSDALEDRLMQVDTGDLVYRDGDMEAMRKVQDKVDAATDTANDITKKTQAKKLFDELTRTANIDPELREEFTSIYNDKDLSREEMIDALFTSLQGIISDYETKEMDRVTEGRYSQAQATDVELMVYEELANKDMEYFVETLRQTDISPRYLAEKIPSFGAWYNKTKQALKDRGIEKPDPITQYELLKLPDDVPLVRNEIECK